MLGFNSIWKLLLEVCWDFLPFSVKMRTFQHYNLVIELYNLYVFHFLVALLNAPGALALGAPVGLQHVILACI